MMIALLAAGFIAIALILFRGRSLRRYLMFEVMSWGAGALLGHLLQPEDPRVALIVLACAKLAAFSVALASAEDVRWSATRAMCAAAIVYAFVIPTQMYTPPDGDEPFYLLISESLSKDHDLDLTNQYRDIAHSATRRPDLTPQPGDPRGKHGEQYSRHEPFLPLLLIPGWTLFGLLGALATMALFGALLARQTVRLLEDEGIPDATVRALFPLFAFAPPVLFYAARVWPEVPGALAFVEALRGVRQRRIKRALPALLVLGLLKLRFALIGITIILLWTASALSGATWNPFHGRRRWKELLLILILPLLVVWLITGNVLNVHAWSELRPAPLITYEVGFFGLLLDGMSGMLFQAPFYLLGVFALFHWRSMPRAFRLGVLASVPYVISLVPRAEWHGGWSPPLRYIVVFMPLLYLGAAAVQQRGRNSAFLAGASLWTAGLALHGLAFPWRLFHIENGENYAGEWLSALYGADFSRLFPSFIRINTAALVASVALVAALLVFRFVRFPGAIAIPLVAVLLALGFDRGRQPAPGIEFEDAHVTHNGGELYPQVYTVARFIHRSGWTLHAGESMSFLARAGTSRLEYASASPARIVLDGQEYLLPATRREHLSETVLLKHTGRVLLRCVAGDVSFDRMRHE